MIVTYILKAAKIYHHLVLSDIRSLPYDYANEIKGPYSWFAKEGAGVD